MLRLKQWQTLQPMPAVSPRPNVVAYYKTDDERDLATRLLFNGEVTDSFVVCCAAPGSVERLNEAGLYISHINGPTDSGKFSVPDHMLWMTLSPSITLRLRVRRANQQTILYLLTDHCSKV